MMLSILNIFSCCCIEHNVAECDANKTINRHQHFRGERKPLSKQEAMSTTIRIDFYGGAAKRIKEDKVLFTVPNGPAKGGEREQEVERAKYP